MSCPGTEIQNYVIPRPFWAVKNYLLSRKLHNTHLPLPAKVNKGASHIQYGKGSYPISVKEPCQILQPSPAHNKFPLCHHRHMYKSTSIERGEGERGGGRESAANLGSSHHINYHFCLIVYQWTSSSLTEVKQYFLTDSWEGLGSLSLIGNYVLLMGLWKNVLSSVSTSRPPLLGGCVEQEHRLFLTMCMNIWR